MMGNRWLHSNGPTSIGHRPAAVLATHPPTVAIVLKGALKLRRAIHFYLRREAQRRYSSYGFSIIFSDTSKKGLNSPNKHGCICNLGHKNQIWGQIWPPRLFGGHCGLKTSFSLLVSNWWKFLQWTKIGSQRPLQPRRSNLALDLEFVAQIAYATMFVLAV